MNIIILIYILLCLLGIIFKRNILLYIGLLLICILITGFNNDNPDYYNYVQRYDWANYPDELNIISTLDISFRVFQAFCKDIGLNNYENFRIVLSIIIFIIFGIVINKYCIYRNLFFIIFSLCYLPLDLIQIRNFFAFIILLPFLLLLNRPTVKNLIIYSLGILIAITIHFSIGICLIFILIGIKSLNTKIILISIFLSLLIIATPLIKLSAITERVDNYTTPSILGGLYMCSWLICNYFIMYIITKFHSQKIYNNKLTKKAYLITPEYIKELNLLLIFLSPLVFMNGTALRIFRFISIINLIFIINKIYKTKNLSNKLSLSVIMIIYSLFFGIQYVYSDPEVTECILKNSIIE